MGRDWGNTVERTGKVEIGKHEILIIGGVSKDTMWPASGLKRGPLRALQRLLHPRDGGGDGVERREIVAYIEKRAPFRWYQQ